MRCLRQRRDGREHVVAAEKRPLIWMRSTTLEGTYYRLGICRQALVV
jgi:hypothetical protein